MSTDVEKISNYFDLIKVDETNFKSSSPHCTLIVHDRIYGGHIFSQTVNALVTLNPDVFPHTFNFKFIAPGDAYLPLEFKLTDYDHAKIASISVSQDGELLGRGHIRYTTEPDFLDSSAFHCPDCGLPKGYSTIEEISDNMEGLTKILLMGMIRFPVEVRPVKSAFILASDTDKHVMWMRIKPEVHKDLKATDGLAVVAFLSDFAIFQAGLDSYRNDSFTFKSMASLHQSTWIHQANLDPYGWYLSVGKVSINTIGRSRIESYIFNENRKCVLTIVQEFYCERAPERTPKFGGIDILINNASAIAKTNTQDTDMKRYDLMHNINTRGTYLFSKLCLPHLRLSASRGRNPHILNLSPPISMKPEFFAGFVAYTMAKYGMSMCVLGMAEEFKPDGIAVNALWPLTAIWTSASDFIMGGGKGAGCKRVEIMSDAAHVMLSKSSGSYTGNFAIDEEVLRAEGVKDFEVYAAVPDLFIDTSKYDIFKLSKI